MGNGREDHGGGGELTTGVRRPFRARRSVLVLVAAALLQPTLGISPSGALAVGPLNDGFLNAAVLNASEGSVTGSNVGATKEPGEPAHAGNPGGSSVWYRWTPAATGRATISTAGSNFDTLLAVYTGDAPGALTAVISNDDAFAAAGKQSAVGFLATAGTVYRIAVDGHADAGGASATGLIMLSWSGATPPAVIDVTRPVGGEKVRPGTNLAITYTHVPPADPRPLSVAPATLAPAAIDELAAIADERGSVKAIVRLNVGFTPDGGLGEAERRAQRHGIAEGRRAVLGRLRGSEHALVRTYESLPVVAVRLSPDALARLRSAPEVAAVTEDELGSPTLARSTDLIEGGAAHAAGFDGRGTTVAVLDTGVDKSHPYLAGKVVEEACYSDTFDCPNGQTSQTGPGSGVPCTVAATECDHGTIVAGIAAGSDAASTGAAPGASLMSVQVFGRATGADCWGGENPCARTSVSDQLAGLEWVYALRTTRSFAAVNMSIGGRRGYTAHCDADPRKLAIDNLRSAGIPTVIGSGNNGFTNATNAPACISSAVSVGASTKSDAIAAITNSATFLSLLAPGAGIVAPVPGGGFQGWTGTSMAAPHVAGAWAVIKEYAPAASVSDVLAALQQTGRPVLDSRNGLIKPRIRVQRAMMALDPRVRIDLLRGGAVVATIVDDLPVSRSGRGSYRWAVPPTLAVANDYTVRVTSVPDPRAGASSASFSITAPRNGGRP